MKILVSSCLLGQSCRYDGRSSANLRERLHAMGFRDEDILPVCPETAGGLPTPRTPAEINGTADGVLAGRDSVRTAAGTDVTAAYVLGALKAAESAKRHGVSIALLKAKSPSCGNRHIYDGHFSGRLVEGSGVAARALSAAGVTVFSETELEALESLSGRQTNGN